MNVTFKTKNNENAIIRKLEVKDAQAVLEYLKRVGSETEFLLFDSRGLGITVDEEKIILDRFYNHPISLLLGCFINNEVVAIANLAVKERERINHVSSIGISVRKEYWHHGIGKKMMEIMIEYAQKSEQIITINLEVRLDNIHAINLYKNLGFLIIGSIPKAMKVNGKFYDHLIMYLDVS
ncbi:MAG: GNAT family N-acetyltransferase [Firmicutes bacterium]|nr:GNAT family N-acetyltransferase [Bacillota bacterium]